MKMTKQAIKDFKQATQVGAYQYRFINVNHAGYSACGINMFIHERIQKLADKVGAEVTLVSGCEGNTYDVMVLEITDPLACHIEKVLAERRSVIVA